MTRSYDVRLVQGVLGVPLDESPIEPQPAPPPKPAEPSVSKAWAPAGLKRRAGLMVRPWVTGVTAVAGDLPNKAVNLGIVAYNRASGSSVKSLAMPSERLPDLLRLPKPATATERVVQEASSAMISAALTVGAAAAAAGGTTGVVNTMLAETASTPVQSMLSSGASVAASATTREADGGQVAQLAAGIAGGLVPVATRAVAARAFAQPGPLVPMSEWPTAIGKHVKVRGPADSATGVLTQVEWHDATARGGLAYWRATVKLPAGGESSFRLDSNSTFQHVAPP